MGHEKVKSIFHVYFHYENKEKHVGNAKFGNDAILSSPSASSTFGSKGVMIFLEKFIVTI